MTAPHNAWADLPNAALIDEVLACVAAWGAARAAARAAARDAARAAARDAAWDAAWGAAWTAVAPLVAWDDAAELYPLTPAQLRLTMQLLPAGDHRRHAAVLLLPYAVARELINTQEQTT